MYCKPEDNTEIMYIQMLFGDQPGFYPEVLQGETKELREQLR
jgi:hypothetical protein